MRNLAQTVGFILLLGLSPLAVALAQGVTLGVKAGANGADISFDPEEDTGLTLGLIGGATVGFSFHEAFAIQLEALFSQKGAEIVDGFDEFVFGLDYFEVPVLARVSVPTGSPLRPVFFAGPAVSFETSCSVSGEIEGVEVDVDCDSPLLDGGVNRKSTDFGIVAGAGFDIDTGPVIVTLEGRYNLGLTNLVDEPGDPTTAKHRVFSLLAGLAFRLPT